VSPDGSEVAVTGVDARGIETFATADLSPVFTYPTTCASRSVAWSAARMSTMVEADDRTITMRTVHTLHFVQTAGSRLDRVL
jgi:hypothetical protein